MPSYTFDPTVPPNTESPRNGATRIRNIVSAILTMLNLPNGSAQTVPGPFISSFDGSGNPTFPALSQVAADPTTATGIVTKQYADAKVPYAAATGGDAYAVTFTDVPNPLLTGQRFAVKFPAANTTTSPTLNVNASGAVNILMLNGGAPGIGSIVLNATYELIFDGAQNSWILVGIANPSPAFPLTGNVSAGGFEIQNLAAVALSGDAMSLGSIGAITASSGTLTFPVLHTGTLSHVTINWGVVAPQNVNANSNSGAVAISYATAFATSAYAVIAGATNVGGAGASGCTVSVDNSSISTSGFSLYIANQTNTNRSMGAQWVAFGQ